MKKIFLIFILSLIINIQFIQLAQAVSGGIFRNIFKIFKGYKKKVIFYRYADGKWSLSNEYECKNIKPLVKKDDNQFVLSAKSIVLIKFYN